MARSDSRDSMPDSSRAVMPSGTSSSAGSSIRASTIESNISCSVGSHCRCGLGTPLAVMPRSTLPHTSYWLFASPMPATRCGCVVMTWSASEKASCATFQLQSMTFATWACT